MRRRSRGARAFGSAPTTARSTSSQRRARPRARATAGTLIQSLPREMRPCAAACTFANSLGNQHAASSFRLSSL
eukprot:2525034-Pleurochrysis_carterae.AAC.2